MDALSKLLTCLIMATAALFVLMITFNALGGIGYKGLFNASVGEISDKYPVYITPAGWTFSIWSVIYVFLGIGTSYCVSTVFRKGTSGSPIYLEKPIVLNWYFYAVLLLNYALNTAWIFIWNAELITAATIFLLFICYTGWMAFAIACYRGTKTIQQAQNGAAKKIANKEIRLQRIALHNGIAFYTTWTTVASLLNINIAFQHFGGYNAEYTSLSCLSALLLMLISWFALENFVFDPYVRYTVSQYPVVIFAASGILSKQKSELRVDGPVPPSVYIMTWVVLGVAIAQLLGRTAVVAYRHRSQALFTFNSRVQSQEPQAKSDK